MDKNTKDALVVWGSTIAGGAGGSWAIAKMGAKYGMQLGPWGAVAGALVGALAGATIAKKLLGDSQGMPGIEPEDVGLHSR